MARLFDAYVMVDWSAAAKPATGANSIWIGVLAPDARLKLVFTSVNPDTRLKARDLIQGIVDRLTGRGDRVLLGFDFALGYPAGTAAALGLDLEGRRPWSAIHAYLSGKIKEKPDNSNSRFAVAAGMNYRISKGPYPFWGAPARDVVSTLQPKKQPPPDGRALAEHRVTERKAREAGKGQPKSTWQLAYTGSVGSQSIMGIPHVAELRQSLAKATLWPFETRLAPLDDDRLGDRQVVIAEIYPSLIKATPAAGEIVDQAQVREIARHYSDLDRSGRLGAAFGALAPLDSDEIAQVEGEEGWILGI